MIIVSKQKCGFVLCHPRVREEIAFCGEQGLHIILRLQEEEKSNLSAVAEQIEDYCRKFFVWRPTTRFRLVVVAKDKSFLRLDLAAVKNSLERVMSHKNESLEP